MSDDLAVFQRHRAHLLALAYRMLGDLARAEDLVQETWLRWQGRAEQAEVPRAYLTAILTRLCLNELDSARVRHEDRSDRLPEPVDLEDGAMGRAETLERISMAFVVMLQRLTPAERAVLLLHEVCDFDHAEIAALVGKSEAASRKLLERAKDSVASERRFLQTSPEEHQRLLSAFVRATSAGDVSALVALLADDAVIVTDGGANGRRVGGVRNLVRPLEGAARIATFLTATSQRNPDVRATEIRSLNGQPALLLTGPDGVLAAILLGVSEGRIHRVYVQGDPTRLRHLGRG